MRTKPDGEYSIRIKELERNLQQLSDRILSLPPEEQADHVKLIMDRCFDAVKKSLQSLPPEQ
jgi:hypothetical protein